MLSTPSSSHAAASTTLRSAQTAERCESWRGDKSPTAKASRYGGTRWGISHRASPPPPPPRPPPSGPGAEGRRRPQRAKVPGNGEARPGADPDARGVLERRQRPGMDGLALAVQVRMPAARRLRRLEPLQRGSLGRGRVADPERAGSGGKVDAQAGDRGLSGGGALGGAGAPPPRLPARRAAGCP